MTSNKHLWLLRFVHPFKWMFIVVFWGGILFQIDFWSIRAIPLSVAGLFFSLLLTTFAVSLFYSICFTNIPIGKTGETIKRYFSSRDLSVSLAPILFIIRLPVVFIIVWKMALFSASSFKSQSLGALFVAGSAIAGLLIGEFIVVLARPFVLQFAIYIRILKRPYLPFHSLMSTSAWLTGVVASVLVLLMIIFWTVLEAASLIKVMEIALFNLAFVVITVATTVFDIERKKVVRYWGGLSTALGVLFVVLGVLGVGGNHTVVQQLTEKPSTRFGVQLGRTLTDYDGDGFSHFLAGRDCEPFDGTIFPGALDVPGNGVDENCTGSDYKGEPFSEPNALFVDPSSICQSGDCNIVLITIDSFRADALTRNGAKNVYMPNLESIEKNSVSFLNAYTPGPGTMTTLPCMLAGKFDSTLKMDPQIPSRHPVHSDVKLISETLTEAGIEAHAILEHGMLEPLNQGWTTFYNPWRPDYASTTTAALQFERIFNVINQSRKPFFIFSHILETHHEHYLHREYAKWGTDKIGRYRSELAFVDSLLGRLIDLINTRLNDRPTILIVSGDHGEGFGEHGILHHNEGLYRAITHVPLIIWHSRSGFPAKVFKQPVSLFDIAPTILNVFNLKENEDHVGVSLMGSLLRGNEPSPKTVYHQAIYDDKGVFYNLVGITRGHFRLLHDMRKQTFELFNVETDPREIHNLVDDDNRKFEEMKAVLDTWLEQIELTSTFTHRYWE